MHQEQSGENDIMDKGVEAEWSWSGVVWLQLWLGLKCVAWMGDSKVRYSYGVWALEVLGGTKASGDKTPEGAGGSG